ncbi:MAG: hypothetical protein H7A24_00520 [Leptospiraceae bacterium]|nr:hypothetical protein [Leptospiraceae bacterium]
MKKGLSLKSKDSFFLLILFAIFFILSYLNPLSIEESLKFSDLNYRNNTNFSLESATHLDLSLWIESEETEESEDSFASGLILSETNYFFKFLLIGPISGVFDFHPGKQRLFYSLLDLPPPYKFSSNSIF